MVLELETTPWNSLRQTFAFSYEKGRPPVSASAEAFRLLATYLFVTVKYHPERQSGFDEVYLVKLIFKVLHNKPSRSKQVTDH